MPARWHLQAPIPARGRLHGRAATIGGTAPATGAHNNTMLLEPQLIAELALLGAVTGFLAGLLGIGGGMLMVPFISIILSAKGYPPEYTVKIAVAPSLAAICFTSLSSVRAHNRR